jgi:hypothetical protein
MWERRGVYEVLVGKHEGNNHWGDPGIDGRIILRWIFRKWVMGYGLACACECGKEPSGSIKCGEFLD